MNAPAFAPYTPPARAAFEQFRMEDPFAFRLPGIAYSGTRQFSVWLSYDYGVFTIERGYVWDGNSFKWRIGPVVIGVSDGPLVDGVPMGKFPSGGHDVIYEHISAIADFLGVSVWAVRAAADRWFYDEWLRRGQTAKEARRYYRAVRAFGWIGVLRRKWSGK